MTTLDDVAKKKSAELPAEQQAAVELVLRAQEQGLSLTGPDGLLKQLTKTVLETGPRPSTGAEHYHATSRDLHHLIQNLPLLAFDALTYAMANFAVILARDDIDNPLSMPHDGHRFAGILT